MNIQPMTMEDVDEIAALDIRCFHIPWSKLAFIDEMNNDMAVYFVAKEGGHCIGYCGFWNVVGEGHITNIAVLPEYRKQGIGSALIETMIRKALELRLYLLTLEVRESNTAAHALYAKYGFQKLGIRRRYYSDNHENAWIMTKELS